MTLSQFDLSLILKTLELFFLRFIKQSESKNHVYMYLCSFHFFSFFFFLFEIFQYTECKFVLVLRTNFFFFPKHKLHAGKILSFGWYLPKRPEIDRNDPKFFQSGIGQVTIFVCPRTPWTKFLESPRHLTFSSRIFKNLATYNKFKKYFLLRINFIDIYILKLKYFQTNQILLISIVKNVLLKCRKDFDERYIPIKVRQILMNQELMDY